ncbi:MAG: hypothetical protein OEX80_07260 [Candidatus Aminicenantes bacterium]|nr:hypothetical protein [Candidatus Aminicenantes bacterium]
MLPLSQALSLGALLFCIIALLYMLLQVRHLPHQRDLATPRGRWWEGIVYAFTKALLPWSKESSTRHLVSYLAGVVFHLSTFFALFLFFLSFWLKSVPASLKLWGSLGLWSGLLCGFGLLLKRIFTPHLRSLSYPDDYFSNALVEAFLLVSWISLREGEFPPYFYFIAVIFFLYLPLGKLRHALFCLYARAVWGSFFGRRGVLSLWGAKRTEGR